MVGQQRGEAAGLRDRADARAPRTPLPAEHLERLDEVVVVLNVDRAEAPQDARECDVGPDHGAGVRDRDPRGALRAADAQAHDRLAALGAQLQREGERRRPADRLEEQRHHARGLVVGQERHVVGGVPQRLGAGRDHAPQPDARAHRHQRLADRARLHDGGHVAGAHLAGDLGQPRRRAPRDGGAHAVRPQHRDVVLGRRGRDPGHHRPGVGARLVAEPGQHDRPRARRHRLGEGVLDVPVADQQHGQLGAAGQLGHRREARDPARLGAGRVHAPDRRVGPEQVRDQPRVPRGGADDGDGARRQQRLDAAAQHRFAGHGHSGSRGAPRRSAPSSSSSPGRSPRASWASKRATKRPSDSVSHTARTVSPR